MDKQKKKIGLYGSLRVLTLSAMLAAVSVVIGIVCKNFLTFNVYYRVTFENLPVIFAGILFGPLVGTAVAVVADTASCLLSTNPAINPLISVGAACVGFCAGAVPRWIVRRPGALQTALSVASAHLLGQVAIKSVAKMLWYGMPWWGAFIGLGISAVAGTVEFFVLRYLFSRKSIMSALEGIIDR
ncbi:MAG TPA: folate family ECF transporter S component [Clostridiales bacterium]|jgi:ECF transporter S component (folate family)|nr:folate family ECF transporter S component [Clostridiales bacterium]